MSTGPVDDSFIPPRIGDPEDEASTNQQADTSSTGLSDQDKKVAAFFRSAFVDKQHIFSEATSNRKGFILSKQPPPKWYQRVLRYFSGDTAKRALFKSGAPFSLIRQHYERRAEALLARFCDHLPSPKPEGAELYQHFAQALQSPDEDISKDAQEIKEELHYLHQQLKESDKHKLLDFSKAARSEGPIHKGALLFAVMDPQKAEKTPILGQLKGSGTFENLRNLCEEASKDLFNEFAGSLHPRKEGVALFEAFLDELHNQDSELAHKAKSLKDQMITISTNTHNRKDFQLFKLSLKDTSKICFGENGNPISDSLTLLTIFDPITSRRSLETKKSIQHLSQQVDEISSRQEQCKESYEKLRNARGPDEAKQAFDQVIATLFPVESAEAAAEGDPITRAITHLEAKLSTQERFQQKHEDQVKLAMLRAMVGKRSDKFQTNAYKVASSLRDTKSSKEAFLTLLPEASFKLLIQNLQESKSPLERKILFEKTAHLVNLAALSRQLGIPPSIPDGGANPTLILWGEKGEGGYGVFKPQAEKVEGWWDKLRSYLGMRQKQYLPMTESRAAAINFSEAMFTDLIVGLRVQDYLPEGIHAETLFPTTIMTGKLSEDGTQGSFQTFAGAMSGSSGGFKPIAEDKEATPLSSKRLDKDFEALVDQKFENLTYAIGYFCKHRRQEEITLEKLLLLSPSKIAEGQAWCDPKQAQHKSNLTQAHLELKKLKVKKSDVEASLERLCKPPEDILTQFQIAHAVDVFAGDIDRHEENWMVKFSGLPDDLSPSDQETPFDWARFYHDEDGNLRSDAKVELAMIDNANIFQTKRSTNAFEKVATRKQYKWKSHPWSRYELTPQAKAFVTDRLTGQSMDKFLTHMREGLEGFDPEFVRQYFSMDARDLFFRRIAAMQTALSADHSISLEELAEQSLKIHEEKDLLRIVDQFSRLGNTLSDQARLMVEESIWRHDWSKDRHITPMDPGTERT